MCLTGLSLSNRVFVYAKGYVSFYNLLKCFLPSACAGIGRGRSSRVSKLVLGTLYSLKCGYYSALQLFGWCYRTVGNFGFLAKLWRVKVCVVLVTLVQRSSVCPLLRLNFYA